MTKWHFPLLALLLAIDVPPSMAGNAIVWSSSRGLFGSKEKLQVPANGDKAPSVFVGAMGGAKVIATGAAAKGLSDALAEQARIEALLEEYKAKADALRAEAEAASAKPAPPAKPRQIEVRGQERLLGGLTEVIPGSGIFITARHVLQGNAGTDLERSFLEAGLDLGKYRFYQFRRGGAIDAVLAIPTGKESEILEIATPEGDCGGETGGISLQLRRLPAFDNSVELNDRFFSFQLGTSGKDETRQVSQGTISVMKLDRFLLSLDDPGNKTTSRSSGSVVYTAKPGKEWKFGGVIECVVPPAKTERGVPIPGAVQVIPGTVLLDSKVLPVSLGELDREKPASIPGCIPIDARGAGGD